MSKNERQLSHSQNFLRNSKLVAKLVADSGINSDDTVFEIGPGKGIITRQLAEKAARVIAVEYDRSLADRLNQTFADYGNVEIVFGDFLKVKLPERDNYKVFSNIPFNLTADILDRLTSVANPPQDSHLIIQEDAAKKYAGSPYGEERLRSLMLKPWFELAITHRFRSTDFHPVPSVNIVMLRIKKREQYLLSGKEISAYRDFVAYAFRQHGKNLKERMKRIFTNKQFWRQASEQKFSSSARPGDLSFEQWLGLFRYFIKGVSNDKQAITRGSYSRLAREQDKLEKIHRTRGAKGKVRR
jgi:23S rRNA (adenine-N6)-dimethyltransferase